MKFEIHPKYQNKKEILLDIVDNYQDEGTYFLAPSRNSIKLFDFDGKKINIKSFKIPNLINKIAYAYFRKSKAQRSYEYASILQEKNIGTPQPIGYLQHYNWLGITNSFYISEQLNCDLTFRELEQIDYPDAENIIRQFIRFTYSLHQNGIEFLDHSPGNTLIIKRENGLYDFYLVDLNRMKFHNKMDFETRMKNLSKITHKENIIAIMSNEYAKLSGLNEQEVFEKMWNETKDFQYRFYRKKRLKKRLKFWKKQ